MFFSCEPEEGMLLEDLLPEEELAMVLSDGVHLSDGLVKFSSVSSFESHVESDVDKEDLILSLKSLSTFTSKISSMERVAGNSQAREEHDDDLYEGFIGEILNEEGMVQIGEYIFKIDLHDETVFVIKEDDDLLDDLRFGNTSNPKVMQFSTDDEVLYLLDEGSTGSSGFEDNGRVNRILCGGGCPKYNLWTVATPWTGGQFETRSRYVKAGIYFELSHHIYVAWTFAPLLVTNPTANRYRKWRRNCSNNHLDESRNNFSMPIQSVSSYGFNGALVNFKETVYSATQGLRNIRLETSYLVDNIWYQGRVINCRY